MTYPVEDDKVLVVMAVDVDFGMVVDDGLRIEEAELDDETLLARRFSSSI